MIERGERDAISIDPPRTIELKRPPPPPENTHPHTQKKKSERTHAIKNALHAPAYELRAEGPEGTAALDAVLEKAAAEGATEVVVHCALSQVRGPACAARLADRAAAKSRGDAAAQPSIKISVLHGGFDAWHDEIGPRDEFTEEQQQPGK